MFKKIFCLMIALLVFALPLSVSAEGETNPEYYVNISALVDGAVPESGEFAVKVTENMSDGEAYEPTDADIPDVVLNADNGYTAKFHIDITKVHYMYEFVMGSIVESVFNDTRTYSVAIGEDILEFVDSTKEDEPQITEIGDGDVAFNAVFENQSAPKLIEVRVEAVGDKVISKVYDGNTDADVSADCFTLKGVAEGTDVKLEFTSAKFNDPNVKKATSVIVSGFKLSGKDAAGYKVVTEKVQLAAEITPRTLTVKADNAVMTLGDSEPTLTYKVTGELIGDDKLIGELARTPGNEVGTYVITVGTLTLSGNSENYNIVFEEGTFTISNYSVNVVTDSASSVSVKGYFDASSAVTVSPISATDSEYKSLFDNAAWGKVISAYNIKLSSNDFDGDITVTFPVPSEYNGKEIAIYQLMSGGAVTCFKTTAADTVSLTTTECTQFMLVTDKDGIEDEEDDEKRSPIATVFIVLLIILGVIVGLILLIVLLFFGMVFFNKTEELKAIIRGVKKLFRK